MQHKISKKNDLSALKSELPTLHNVAAIRGGTMDEDSGNKPPKDEGRGGTPPKGPAGNIPNFS